MLAEGLLTMSLGVSLVVSNQQGSDLLNLVVDLSMPAALAGVLVLGACLIFAWRKNLGSY